jgi:hypothetical protein
MIDTIFRVAAILVMIGVIGGAGRIAWWLGSAWFQRADVVPLHVKPFEVAHGDKVEREEGKHLATALVTQIERIQGVLTRDLSHYPGEGVRTESAVPKSLRLEPAVAVKIDIEAPKPFDIDVVGILQALYDFF